MTKYKALVLDVDGTLINRSLEISPKVKKAILKIKKQISVSLCSGRTYNSYIKYIDQLGLTSLQVSDAGAVIVNPQKDKIVYEKHLKEKVALSLIKILKNELSWPFLVSINNRYYFDSALKKKINQAFGLEPLPPHIQEAGFSLSELTQLATPKITVMGCRDDKDYQVIEKMLEKFVEDIHFVRSVTGFHGGGSGDITDKTVSKLSGLIKLSELTKIPLSQTIVVGDGYNDFPLLLAGGLKVAMGNAVPDLKKIADYIAPTVDEDGVAKVIEKFLS